MSLLVSLFGSTLYVQVSPERVTVRNPRSGESVSEIPEIAIARDPKPRITGVGAEARLAATSPGIEVFNPFAHPRTLISDFTLGEQVLKALVKRVKANPWLPVSPKVVIHPLGNPAGGLTQVEIRALHEMAIGAGASSVKVWQGRALTDQEILSGVFPVDGSVLS